MIDIIRTIMGRRHCLRCQTEPTDTWYERHIIDPMPLWLFKHTYGYDEWVGRVIMKWHDKHH